MEENTNTKRTLIIVAIICCLYLLLTIFYYYINKHLTGVLYLFLASLIPITFILIVVYEIKGIAKIISNRKNLSFLSYLPLIICSITLLYTLFSPYKLDSEKFESNIVMRACYEGTQNQAYILFREDKTFELNWTGVFGYNEWWTGKWSKKNDIIILHYDDKMVEQLGDKVLIANGYLNPIGNSVNKIKFPRPMFYIGDCKHEN